MTKMVSVVSGALVLGLAVVSFVISFVISFGTFTALVIEVGIGQNIAWLYPTIIDGAIVIIFSLSVLRAKLANKPTTYPWVLVGVFILISVVLNIAHAPANLLARVLSGIPPAALFLSFGIVCRTNRSSVGNFIPKLCDEFQSDVRRFQLSGNWKVTGQ